MSQVGRNKSILMHFDSKHDLFHAIEVLQHFKISISEVYTPQSIPLLEKKLRIREIKHRSAFLKYGCMGGATLTTLFLYLLDSGIVTGHAQKNYTEVLVNILVIALTFVIALYIFPSKTPKIKTLRKYDQRYLMVIKSSNMTEQHEQVTHLMRYAEAVELSSDIKNMIAC